MAAAGLAAMAAGAGAPVVKQSSVTMTQDGGSRRVTIGYTLEEEPAIVTVDIQTNGVSIGGRNLWYFAGDVNKRVDVGPHTMTWRPDKAWPGHKLTDGVTAVVTAWATNTPPDVMVISLVAEKTRLFYPSFEAVPGGVNTDLYKTEMMAFRKCPAGNVTWRMGSPTNEHGRVHTDEKAHLVTLNDDFYIGVFPVTQRQWQLVTGNTPSTYKGFAADCATRPVEMVSYYQFRGANWPTESVNTGTFVGKLRTFTGLAALDLPLEAQWEFACRAGCGATLYDGSNPTVDASDELARLARYASNGGRLPGGTIPSADCTADYATAKVGTYAPNAWGIYDMLGNVFELCLDQWASDRTGCDPNIGPTDGGTTRVMRGGSYENSLQWCRCAFRKSTGPSEQQKYQGGRRACSVVIPD